ncbi:hypothetical protein GX586_08880, partial [bacterium]|nr:hypothetical protein [bacterium]
GCPPFTRNGNNTENSMSKVAYTRGNDLSSTHDFSFENEVYLKLAGIASLKAPTAEEMLGFDAEIGASFKNNTSIGWGYTESFKSRGTETFYSMTTNKDGKYGQLVYAQPTIDTQPYCVYSQDGSVRLLSYNTVNVGMLNIGYEKFELANPPKGMVALEPTSDLPYWKNDRPEFLSYSPQVYKLLSKQLLPSQFSDSGGSFVRTWEGYFEVGNKSSLGVIVNAKAVLFLGLKVESRNELSFEFKYSQKESWSEELSFNIGVIPAPPTGSSVNIQGMAVDAYCYMPMPGVDLRKILRPEWLPDSRVNKQFQVPWLMTWKVKGTE